jgi:hypothetical protein
MAMRQGSLGLRMTLFLITVPPNSDMTTTGPQGAQRNYG